MRRTLQADFQGQFDEIQILCQKLYASASRLKGMMAKYEIPQHIREEWIKTRQKEISKVFLDTLHLKIFMQLAEEICTVIPLSQFVVMGSFVRAIKKWQIDTSQSFLLVTQQPRPIKIHYIAEILTTAKKLISRCISKFPNKEIFFDDLFNQLLDQYEEYLSISLADLDRVGENLSEWR